jgi:flavin reductase (DIM6/NTAB) family NADH-FMN oxidoreductase RutF
LYNKGVDEEATGMEHHATETRSDRRAEFRECMSTFTTGVTVVLAEAEAVPAGATVNSFTSVSLEPLLVLASLGRTSRTLRTIRSAGRFTISVLGREQEHVASAFSRPSAPFPEDLVTRSGEGLLYVRGALAHLACTMDAVHTMGDHDVVVGEISDMVVGHGDPLVFHRGAFVGLSGQDLAPAV